MFTTTVTWSLLLTILVSTVTGEKDRESEWTVEIGAGKEECFYEQVNAGEIIEIDYQVVDGGSRNELDINFRIYRPNNGMILVSDFKKSDNAHRTSVDLSGDYKICFDNAYSRFANKIVFFELIIDGEDEDEEDGEEVPEDNSLLKNMEEEDIQVSKIDKALKIMKEHMTRSRQFQDLIKASEYRDRSVAEHNFENVNFWSLVHLSIMIVSGICQVILVRSLFDDKSRFHAIWKKIC
ncbi:transmembrane emp24 domain-containing protein 1 [Lepeophtheirus salmonis]|uniref:transmembrane emp24 domain-containing protein 1 n=1 Tax=Lepeophtheirus salmonis TaxID=72036 RepID=UPI001AE7F9C8|nr:transmembrane emp24 domain-containing protein 1-like [Lepeophtheirus salmonis]